jgi:subtilase family serine protease
LSLKFSFSHPRQRSRLSLLALAAILTLSLSHPARPASDGEYIANNTPRFVASAKNLGSADAAITVEVSIWLKPQDRAALDALAGELYDPQSPQYRHWLTNAEVAARFAPSAAEVQAVQSFFESNELKVSGIGPHNFYVRARGTVAQVEKAFRVKIDNYQVAGQVLRSNSGDPYVEGPAAPLVQSVSGLDDVKFQQSGALQPNFSTAATSQSGASRLTTAAAASGVEGFTSDCFPGPQTEHVTTLGGYPQATYSGNRFVSGSGTCGYTPANISRAYNLDALYAEGLNGSGQTIVLIEACGSPTILRDANTFSTQFGLPRLSAANFSIVNVAPSTCAGYFPNINADVEWAHAIAPGATLALVVAASQSSEDLDEAVFQAVSNGIGNVISDDNYAPEFFVGQTEVQKESLISEIAAVQGISTNYAAGELTVIGEDTFAVTAPADGPYATGIGGISLGLNSEGAVAFQTAWESHGSLVQSQGVIYDPSSGIAGYFGGFIFGGAGGPSQYFAKPAFQKAVAGTQRQIPDFAWLGDPFTGALILVTEPIEPPQVWTVYGGTELATPMFSALWAIANQRAGVALGQAAPYLYSMQAPAIQDIVPYSSPDDVVALVEETSSSAARFTAAEVLQADEPEFGKFYTALWVDPSGEENTGLVLSFGADYFMKPAVGWDKVTGVGAPLDAKAFVDSFGGAGQ